jgi:hypothetical protein
MGNHPDWPPTPRALYAAARCLAYLMVAVAGLDVTFGRLNTTGEFTSHLWIDIIGILAAIAGTAGSIAAIFRRWKIEWHAVGTLTVVLTVYTAFDWYSLVFGVGYPPLLLAVIALGAGATVVAAVTTGESRWRWLALAAATVILGIAIPLEARNPAIITALTAMCAGRYIELWVFNDSTKLARTLSTEAMDP